MQGALQPIYPANCEQAEASNTTWHKQSRVNQGVVLCVNFLEDLKPNGMQVSICALLGGSSSRNPHWLVELWLLLTAGLSHSALAHSASSKN